MNDEQLDSGAQHAVTALRDLTAPSESELVALHRRLEAAAEVSGILDVAYTTIDSPVGRLLLAGTGRGLVRIAFEREDHDRVLETLAARLSPRVLHAPERLAAAVRQVEEYFAGRRTDFDLALDRSLSSGFRQVVQQQIARIDYGRTQTYRDLAVLVGNAGAVRAVGTACATNPLPVVVPCHRVLRTDGSLGGYIGGLDAKAALLALEGAA